MILYTTNFPTQVCTRSLAPDLHVGPKGRRREAPFVGEIGFTRTLFDKTTLIGI